MTFAPIAPTTHIPRTEIAANAYVIHQVRRVQGLDIMTIAACHTPVIEGPFIQRAFERIREFPLLDPPPMPDQSILDQIIAARRQRRSRQSDRLTEDGGADRSDRPLDSSPVSVTVSAGEEMPCHDTVPQ
jgi:hypothetical protein